jgi:hypothetical protein
MGTLREDQYTFMIISGSIHALRNVSDKNCRENQTTLYVLFFSPKIVPFMRYCGKILQSQTCHR